MTQTHVVGNKIDPPEKLNLFFNHITSRIKISQSEFETVAQKFSEVRFKKRQHIIEPGQTATFHFFVLKGCLRSYFIDETGKEHTVQFAIENWWIGDYTSYFGSEKSILHIECLEDCHLIRIDKDVWESFYQTFPQLETYTRINLQRRLASAQKQTIINLSLSAKERYSTFLSTYPNIEKRVRNYHIASYLGITRESLSRVRKEHLPD
jgi:CRP-like cAMP-binding protein